MDVSYQNTLGDLLRFNLHHIPRMPYVQLMIAALLLAQVVFVLPAVVEASASVPERAMVGGLLVAASLALVLLLMVAVALSGAYLNGRDALSVYRTVRITDAGVDEACVDYRRLLSWTDISDVRENGTHIYLYTGPNLAFVIPKRAFQNHRLAQAFCTFAREQWGFCNGVRVAA